MPLVLPEDDPCSFCEYLAGRRPYTVFARDAAAAVLVTRQQRGRMHVLVIPTAHRPTVLDLTAAEYGPVMAYVARAARAVAAAVEADGIAVWQKNGERVVGADRTGISRSCCAYGASGCTRRRDPR